MIQRLIRTTIAITLIATLGYAALLAVVEADRLSVAFDRIGARTAAFVLIVVIAGYFVRFVRWEYYARRLGHSLPIRLHVQYYFAGLAFTATPGKSGEALKSLYLRKHGIGYVQSVAMVFAERTIDVLVMAIFSLLAIGLLHERSTWVASVLLAMIAALAMLAWRVQMSGLQGLVLRIPSERMREIGTRVLGMLSAAARLMGGDGLAVGIGLGMVAWGAEAAAFYVLVHQFAMPIPLAAAAGIYALSILVGALSFLPGGIGGTEAMMGVLLVAAGADLPDSLVVVVAFRVATLWFAVLLGFSAIGVLRLQNRPLLAVRDVES